MYDENDNEIVGKVSITVNPENQAPSNTSALTDQAMVASK